MGEGRGGGLEDSRGLGYGCRGRSGVRAGPGGKPGALGIQAVDTLVDLRRADALSRARALENLGLEPEF